MALFRKPSEYTAADATEPTAPAPPVTSSGDWQKTIEALTEKLAASEAELAGVVDQRDGAALNLVMTDEAVAAPQLAHYADRISQLERAIGNTKGALGLAKQHLKEAHEQEARDAEAQRVATLQRLFQQYLTGIQAVDVAMSTLALAFSATRTVLDQIHDHMKPEERMRVNQLQSVFGPTCAACFHGFAPYLDFGASASHRRFYQPLAAFVAPFVMTNAPAPAPPPVDNNVNVSESEALAQPRPAKVN